MIAKYTAPGLTKWLLARIVSAGDSSAAAARPQPASATAGERQ
jgi:hypothetical protein